MDSLVVTLIKPSSDKFEMLRAKFKDDDVGVIVNYFNTLDNTLVMSWEEIK